MVIGLGAVYEDQTTKKLCLGSKDRSASGLIRFEKGESRQVQVDRLIKGGSSSNSAWFGMLGNWFLNLGELVSSRNRFSLLIGCEMLRGLYQRMWRSPMTILSRI